MSAYLLRFSPESPHEHRKTSLGASHSRALPEAEDPHRGPRSAAERSWRCLDIGSHTSPASLPTAPLSCINGFGDLFGERDALEIAARFCASRGTPSVNSPERVLGCAPELLADKLRSIPGVHVRRMVVARTDYQDDLPRLADLHSVRYPLLVRLFDRTHRHDAALIESVADWPRIYRWPWPGRALCLTEFEHAEARTTCARLELTVVGADVAVTSAHSPGRTPPDAVPGIRALFGAAHRPTDVFDLPVARQVRECVLAIAATLELDYFAIDLTLRPDGQLYVDPGSLRMDDLVTFPADEHASATKLHLWNHLKRLLRAPLLWRTFSGSARLRAVRG